MTRAKPAPSCYTTPRVSVWVAISQCFCVTNGQKKPSGRCFSGQHWNRLALACLRGRCLMEGSMWLTACLASQALEQACASCLACCTRWVCAHGPKHAAWLSSALAKSLAELLVLPLWGLFSIISYHSTWME